MSRVSLSDDELRGLSEGGDDLPSSPAIFEPADFSDASRAAHRLLGALVARISGRLGGTPEPLPPEIRMTVAEGVRLLASRNAEWAIQLEFTGQFRAVAILAISSSSPELALASPETLAVLFDAGARDVEVAFRQQFQRAVAVQAVPFRAAADEFPLRGGTLVSLDFDLETGGAESAVVHVVGEVALVRELASLVRPGRDSERKPAPKSVSAPKPAAAPASRRRAPELALQLVGEIGRCEMSLAEAAALSSGQVVRLDARAGDIATLTAGGRTVATGEVVVSDGFLALKLMEIVPPTDWAEPEDKSAPGHRAGRA